jgi:hypothetical protein
MLCPSLSPPHFPLELAVTGLHPRFFFFWCLVSPICILVSKWLALPLMIYIPSYLDGTEKSGGRPSEFHRNFFLWFWCVMNLAQSANMAQASQQSSLDAIAKLNLAKANVTHV